MSKKPKRSTPPPISVTVRPAPPTDTTCPPRTRTVRARRSGDSFQLISDALDLGLVAGDVVSCAAGPDGRRYLSGIVRLRHGTLTQVGINGSLCRHHFGEFVDQATEDWLDEGVGRIQERGGSLYGFWPPEMTAEDARMVVELSAAEFHLTTAVIPADLRQALIGHCVSFGPPAAVQAA